jgi:gliding motility-associated-like protein
LVFPKPILCSSIAADGSDFRLTGPDNVNIIAASGNCAGLYATAITLKLSKPVERAGNYTVELVNGSDGNTLLNNCSLPTPVGSTVAFTAYDTVSAAFNYTIDFGCTTDTVYFSHDGRNGVNNWKWTIDAGIGSIEQNPTHYYTKFGDKPVTLIVSNGVCRDTAQNIIALDNEINAAFGYPSTICPNEPAVFSDKSSGKINSWNWDFGNGFSSNVQNPAPQPFIAPVNTREVKYQARLIVGNEIGCFDTATVTMKAVSSCYITVPSAFTPNDDKHNDYLYPLNAFKAEALSFKVFNRYGQLVFETTDWTKAWDGTLKGKPQSAGVYVWVLSYTEADTGKKFTYRGTTVLIR